MRKIDYIVLHCTATPINTSVQSILNYWKNNLKWRNPGYHYLIEQSGMVHELLPIDKVSNGVAGYNSNSIHISYIGGVDKNGKGIDNRSSKQILEQIRLIIQLKEQFPNARIQGHRDFPNVAKACPSFDTREWLKGCGLLGLL